MSADSAPNGARRLTPPTSSDEIEPSLSKPIIIFGSIISRCFRNLITKVNGLHFYFTIGAFLCFLPQWLKYDIVLEPYPDGLEILSEGLKFRLSLILSITILIAMVLENVLDCVTKTLIYNQNFQRLSLF